MEKSKKVKLGLFVMLGTLFLIVAMYFIGSNQSLFTSTFKIQVNFKNVNGLMPGNNVRYAGIDVGTVNKIQIINDSTIQLTLLIEEKSRKFIRINALVSIGTDGLMGNKLVNINPVTEPGRIVQNGDILHSIAPVETDEMLRILQRTNDDVYNVVKNLKTITEKVNQSNTFWRLLTDSVVSNNIRNAIINIQLTGERTALISGDLNKIVHSIKEGKGNIGALLMDTSISYHLKQTIVQVKLISDTLASITGDLHFLSSRIRKGEGAIGTIIMDTTFVNNLNQSLINIRNSSEGLDQNMEALKASFLLRRYFKKQDKKKTEAP